MYTGSEKMLRKEIFELQQGMGTEQIENFYSSYSNPEGGEDTVRMDQFDAYLPEGTGGSSKKRELDEDRSCSKLIC